MNRKEKYKFTRFFNTKTNIVMFLVILIVIGCESENKDFKRAQRINNPEALESFLKKYPTGQHAEKAKRALYWAHHDRDLEETIKKNTINDYLIFCLKYPGYSQITTKEKSVSVSRNKIKEAMRKLQSVIRLNINIKGLQYSDRADMINQIMSNLESSIIDPRVRLELVTPGLEPLTQASVFADAALLGVLDVKYKETESGEYYIIGREHAHVRGTNIKLDLSLRKNYKVNTTWDNVSLSESSPFFYRFETYGGRWPLVPEAEARLCDEAKKGLFDAIPPFAIISIDDQEINRRTGVPVLEDHVYSRYLIEGTSHHKENLATIIEVLENIGDENSINFLIAFFKEPKWYSKEKRLRKMAFKALTKLKDKDLRIKELLKTIEVSDGK